MKRILQSRPYEFMIQFTPQREWIERRGILVWLALYFIELGAGTFVVSSIFGVLPGMFVGWLICAVLGGGLHLLYLGRPGRAWRMIISSGWKTSWMSRGLYFVVTFLVLGSVQMILTQRLSSTTGLLIITDFFAFCTVAYAGFVMNFVNGIQLWNTALLPALFTLSGVWGGIGLSIVVASSTGAEMIAIRLEPWTQVFLMGYAFIISTYLVSVRYSGLAGRFSVRNMLTGKWGMLFWGLVVSFGILFPVGATFLLRVQSSIIANTFLYILIFFELLGDLSLRYCILRCGYYQPMIPSTNFSF